MSIPVEVQILNAIDTRLNNMTVTNGYSADVNKIKRATLTPFSNGDLPAINYWPIKDSLIERIHGREKRSLIVLVEYHDKSRDKNFSDLAFDLKTDVMVALWRSVSFPLVTDPPSSGLGGIVTTVTLDSSTPAIGEGANPVCGVVLEISIVYFIDPSSPFTLIS